MMRAALSLVLLAAGCGPASQAIDLTIDAPSIIAGIATFAITVQSERGMAHSDFPAPGGLVGIPPAHRLTLMFDDAPNSGLKFLVEAKNGQGDVLARGRGALIIGRASALTILLGGTSPVDAGVDFAPAADLAMCTPDLGRCPSGCIDLLSDVTNCGYCNNDCTKKKWANVASYQCSTGMCGPKGCAPGYQHCSNLAADGCETDITRVENCGGCKMDCNQLGWPHVNIYQCTTAQCSVKVCETGFGDCGMLTGCETDLTSTVVHCGSCNNDCTAKGWPHVTSYSCQASQCQPKDCEPGWAHCSSSAADGCEVNTATDPTHCGACRGLNAVCEFGVPCKSGVCTKEKLLVIGTDDTALFDIANLISAMKIFESVATFNAGQNGGFLTPALSYLQQFPVVLVFASGYFASPITLGDNLADYYDSGGRVVTAPWANLSNVLYGRFSKVGMGYMLIEPTAGEVPGGDGLGKIYEPKSPLVLGAKTLNLMPDSSWRSTGNPVNGGISVADWASGRPLIVRGMVKGRPRVDLNFYLAPKNGLNNTTWTGDGANILRNALVFR